MFRRLISITDWLNERLRAGADFLDTVETVRSLRKDHPAGGLVMFRPINREGQGEQGEPLPPGLKSDTLAHEIDVWIFTAIGTIARAFTEAPLIGEELQIVDGKDQWTQLNQGPICDLLQRPNPNEPFIALIWKTILSLMTAAKSHWLHSEDYSEAWLIRPDWVEIVGKADGTISHYIIKNEKAQQVEIPEALVTTITIPSHVSHWYGLSAVKPIREAALTNYYYDKYISGFFKKGAIPGGILTTDKRVDKKQRDQAREAWNEYHQGQEKVHNIGILGSGYKYQTMSPPLKEMAIETLTKVPREKILASFGLPPVLAGIYDSANYSTSDNQIRIFWQNNILPICRLIQATLNMKLVPRLQGKPSTRRTQQARFRFMVEKVLALQPDKEKEANRASTLYNGGVSMLNESREIAGLPPVEDGDQFKPQPTGVFQEANLGQVPTNWSLSNGTVKIEEKRFGRDIWTAFVAKATSIERILSREWVDFLTEQRNRVVARLIDLSGKGASMASVWLRIRTKDDGFLSPDLDALFNIGEENVALQERFGPIIFELAEDAGQDSLERFGISGSFDVRTPVVEDFLAGMVNKMKDVNEFSWKQIKELLQTAETEGWTFADTVREIQTHPQLFNKDRAIRVVRTEGTTLANGSAQEAWSQAGVKAKKWLATFDNVTRRAHAIVNGQARKIGKPFDVGGEKADYPGDYKLRADNRINCRCTMVPADNEDDGFEEV